MSKRITIAILAVVAAVLLILHGRNSDGKATEMHASIQASQQRIGPFGRVAVQVKVDGEPVTDKANYQYDWQSSAGHISGTGARAEWVAPSARGNHVISVTVRDRERDLSASASISINVRSYPGMNGSFPSVSHKADDSAAGGSYTIGRVTFDKTKLCANDDVRVHVEASDPSGRPDWVMPLVRFPGKQVSGFDTIAHVGAGFVERGAAADAISVVLIDTRTRRTVATKKVPFTINACKTKHAGLVVRCHTGGGRPDEVLCEASARRAQGFHPVRYEWQIDGDDQVVKTSQPWFRHLLPKRVQTQSVQTFIIRAKAFDAADEWIAGRASHLQRNAYWETAQMTGLLQLEVHFGRVLRDGDSYVAPVQLSNPFSEPVRLDAIQIERIACSDDNTSPRIEADPLVNAAAELGATELQPGASLSYRWRLPVDPERCDARATLTGEGVTSGLPAKAVWRMPTNPKARRALTGTERQRVRKALSILSKRRGETVHTITRTELDDLVREGVLPRAAAQPRVHDRKPGTSW